MKISVSQYAKSLYGATQGKSQKEIDVVSGNFFKVLQKNNQMKLARKVVEKFSDLWNKEQGIVEAEVTTSRKLEDPQIHGIEKFIKEKYDAKKVSLSQKIDEKIKGGIIIRVGDELLDASVANMLRNLKRELIK